MSIYDSQAGTFLMEDSYQGDLTDPLSQNRYIYAQNNPVNYTDPSGHFIKGLIAGAKGLYQKAKSAVSNAWEKAQNLISSGVSAAKKVASKVAGYVGTVAKPLAVNTKTAYTSNVNTGLSALTTVVQSVAQGMGQIASSAVHYVSRQQQDAVWTTTNAWLQAKAFGESDYNWQGAKIREAANIFRNWTSALEQTIKHVCEVANRADGGQGETKSVDFTGNRLVEQERLQQALETIKASSEDEIEKTDQIVKAYEDYLYLSNKEAFDEYWKVRKNYKGDWKRKNTDIDDVEETLGKKLQNSGINIKTILNQMGDDIIKVNLGEGKLPVMVHSDIVSFTMGNLHFKDLVNTGEPLDLKTRVYGEMEFSVWARQWESGLDTDYAGNYLYGYVGKGYLGAPDFYLKGAAGTAQILSNKNIKKWFENLLRGNYGDNAGDSQMIQDGIDALMNKVKRGDK